MNLNNDQIHTDTPIEELESQQKDYTLFHEGISIGEKGGLIITDEAKTVIEARILTIFSTFGPYREDNLPVTPDDILDKAIRKGLIGKGIIDRVIQSLSKGKIAQKFRNKTKKDVKEILKDTAVKNPGTHLILEYGNSNSPSKISVPIIIRHKDEPMEQRWKSFYSRYNLWKALRKTPI